ncbi:MAG: hypothetical protein ACQEP9_05140 [Bacillota bacterium]
MELTNRELKLLILAIVIVGGGSLLKWGIVPLANDYQALDKELKTKETEWINNKKLLENSLKYKKTFQQTKGELEQLNSLIFQNDINQAQLKGLNILTAKIKKSALEVKHKNIRVETKPEKDYSLLVYDFSVSGSFQQLIDLLVAINQADRLFMVEQLQLAKNTTESGKLQIDLMIKTIGKENGINIESNQ